MIIELYRLQVGAVGVRPGIVCLYTSGDFSEITTAAFINSANNLSLVDLKSSDFLLANYDSGSSSGIFTPSIANGVITLTPYNLASGATVAGDFAVFSNTTGALTDDGYSPSDATKTKVAMASAAVVANHIACFSDTAGTVNDDAATAINAGNIQAGLSGTAGTLASFPSTALKGSLKLVGVANTGNTDTTISNAAMGQATVLTIPDPGTATAKLVTAPAAFVNGNLIKASGVAGLVADAGGKIISGETEVWGGGGTSHTFTALGLTTGSKGAVSLLTSTNTVAVKVAPGVDTLIATFSGDPGSGTQLGYIYTSAAMS